MPHPETNVQCSNPSCLKTNSLATHFCQQCRTPLVKRYFWAVDVKSSSSGKSQTAISASETVIEPRYVSFGDRIFLDTQPAKKTEILSDLPVEIVNYLQLLNCFPHVPKVYAQIEGSSLWLLDYGTVPLNPSGELLYSELLPRIESVWADSPPCKQLSWLIQLASLWSPLEKKSVRQTLLKPELIAVNGSLIQLMELSYSEDLSFGLSDLGQVWSRWAHSSQPQVREVLVELTQQMVVGGVATITEDIAILDGALEICSQSQEYRTETYAISESGPRRKNNQDHAHPNSSAPIAVEGAAHSLAIVCDGVGGHEGGEIASQNTVSYISDRVIDFDWSSLDNAPAQVISKLASLTNEANDALNERNNREQRQERQRMGTTLVMSLAHKYELFLNHVGDSRIYFITPESCHQVTIDDDLASRETRLGYALYRDALQYPSAGALIQALGMRHSDALHPNVRRLAVDGEYILLLCTDGLSDFDRVEQYWHDVLTPVFQGKWDLSTAVKALIKIANERNGHDNATAALVHFQVQPNPDGERKVYWSDVEKFLNDSTAIWESEELGEDSFFETDSLVDFSTTVQDLSDTQFAVAPPTESTSDSESFPEAKKTSNLVIVAIALISLLVLGAGILVYTNGTKNNGDPRSPDNSPEVRELEESDNRN